MDTDQLLAESLQSFLPKRKPVRQSLLTDAPRADVGGQLLDSVTAPTAPPVEDRTIDRTIFERRSAPDPDNFPMPTVPMRDNRAEQSGAAGEIAAALLSSALLGARNPAAAAARYGMGRQKGLDANRQDQLRDFQNEAAQSDAEWRRANQEFAGNFRVDSAVDRLEEAERNRLARKALQEEKDTLTRERDAAKRAGDETTVQLKEKQLEVATMREERLNQEAKDRPYRQRIQALQDEYDDPRTNEPRRAYLQGEIARLTAIHFKIGKINQVTGQPEIGPPGTKGMTPGEKAADADRDRQIDLSLKRFKLDMSKFTAQEKQRARQAAREGKLDAFARQKFEYQKAKDAKPKAAAAQKPIDTAGDLGKLQKFDADIEAKKTRIAQLKAGKDYDETIKIKGISTKQKKHRGPNAAELAEIQGLENQIKTQQSAKEKVAKALGYKWSMERGEYVFVGRTQTLPDGSTVTVRKK